MSVLDRITGPADLKGLSITALAVLAQEIRAFLNLRGHLRPTAPVFAAYLSRSDPARPRPGRDPSPPLSSNDSPAHTKARSLPRRSDDTCRTGHARAAGRVNPGNIKKFDDKIKHIAAAATDTGVPIRIGINTGSLDPRLLAKYGHASAEALVESALRECSLFEEHDFRDIKISVKHHDPLVMITAYRQLAQRRDYPLRIAVMGCVVNSPRTPHRPRPPQRSPSTRLDKTTRMRLLVLVVTRPSTN